MMRMVASAIDPESLRKELVDPAAGAYTSFEGWIRNVNEGQQVLRLEYEAYEPLAITEGEKVIAEARERFPILHAHCVHRHGLLEIDDMDTVADAEDVLIHLRIPTARVVAEMNAALKELAQRKGRRRHVLSFLLRLSRRRQRSDRHSGLGRHLGADCGGCGQLRWAGVERRAADGRLDL